MRKILLVIVAVITAVLSLLQKEIGISIDASAVGVALTAVVVYLFGEAKNDIERVKTEIWQNKKWRDPAFWTSLGAVLIPVLNSKLKMNIPVEIISGALATVAGILFAKRQKELTK
jgi:cobalamin synthase